MTLDKTIELTASLISARAIIRSGKKRYLCTPAMLESIQPGVAAQFGLSVSIIGDDLLAEKLRSLVASPELGSLYVPDILRLESVLVSESIEAYVDLYSCDELKALDRLIEAAASLVSLF